MWRTNGRSSPRGFLFFKDIVLSPSTVKTAEDREHCAAFSAVGRNENVSPSDFVRVNQSPPSGPSATLGRRRLTPCLVD